jgi:hypothetical protein
MLKRAIDKVEAVAQGMSNAEARKKNKRKIS